MGGGGGGGGFGGGYSVFQVTGMIEGFWGVRNFRVRGIFGVENFGKCFFGLLDLSGDFFAYSKQSKDS